MPFNGTAATRESGLGVIVAAGMATELERISGLIEEAQEEQTPLERRLDRWEPRRFLRHPAGCQGPSEAPRPRSP